jgi:predicted outer membrane repeat protein
MSIEKIKAFTFAMAGTLAVSMWPASGQAAVLFAKVVAAGAGTCNSPANAGTLSNCIALAVAGDHIRALAGTHVLSGVTIAVPLTINGDGMGTSIVDAHLNDRHFVVAPGVGGSVLIKDLTLTNGSAVAAGGAFADGGALQVTSGSLELVRTEITNSTADAGGAISCNGCTELTVRDSRLVGNTATTDGGAIETDADTTLVANSLLQGNKAGDQGGGIYKQRNSITIRDSEIVANTSAGDGGGLFSATDYTTVRRSAFISNSSSGDGGGVSMHGNAVTDESLILNSTFSANVASSGGAVDVGVINPAFLGNVTMVDNLATTAGQADDIESSSALVSITLSNSIVTHPTIGGVNPECGNAGAPVTLAGINNLIDTSTNCLPSAAGFRIGAITAGTLGGLNFHDGPTRSYSLVNVAGNNAVDNPVVGQCLNPRSGVVVERDQRFHSRPVGAGALCDIGSFEL